MRREELQSPPSSPRSSPDRDLEQLLRSRIEAQFAFTARESDDAHNLRDATPSDDEAELRLFAAPVNAPTNPQKIRLSSPAATRGEPGFAVKKPRSYYFVDERTSEEEAALKSAAVDGKTVIAMSREPWPGCALPWKVRKISPAGMKREVLVGHPPTLYSLEEPVRRKARKGKKARIALRQKLQAVQKKKSEAARVAQEKEEAEREKRTRRNREKKVKKKAREKAKKAMLDGSSTEVDNNGDPTDDEAASN